MSWITDLDACASAGILEFDAPAFIKGATPRYCGHPPFETIPGDLPPIKDQPQKDEFQKNNGSAFSTPRWKKVLFGALAIGALAFGLYKIPAIKNKLASINLGSLKNIPSKIFNGVKSGWNKFVNLFKKTPKP